MGKVTKGEAKGFSGKVGGLIYSQQKDGSTTVREANDPKELPPPTENQLRAREDAALASNITGAIKGFIDVGYKLQAKKDKMNQNNSCVSFMKLNLLSGVFKERKIDLSRLLVSRGKMPLPEQATVSPDEIGFLFTWNPEVKVPGIHYSDQVMMLAYFPQLKCSEYVVSGAQRDRGKDILRLTGIKKGYVADVYIAFISDNRKRISDSLYLGQVNW